MIKKLRLHLTLLYTLTTGFILTIVVIGVLAISSKELQKKNLDAFQNSLITISSQMQVGATIDCTWLARMEAENNLIIHMEDNQTPLLFSGSWSPPTSRKTLLEKAWEKSREEGVNPQIKPVSSSAIRSSVFTVEGNNSDTYYSSVLIMPSNKGFHSLTLLSYISPDSVNLYHQRFFLAALDILGVGALFLVSWFFVGRSLIPVEESQIKQSEFIASASHELRSPLAVIRSTISAIPGHPAQQNQFLQNMDKECLRMSRLIDDMLLLASTDAKNWSLRLSPVNLDTLMIDIFERFEPICAAKHQSLHLEFPDEILPVIMGDSQRLEQILTILIDNASSYTPENKSITIRAFAADEIIWAGKLSPLLQKSRSVCLEVSDQGCGISDEAKKHIFDRFYREDKSRTDKQHFGLGLCIANELIQLHNGKILVKDSHTKGACFQIYLPVNR